MKYLKPILFVGVGLLVGFLTRGVLVPSPPRPLSPSTAAAPKVWTCSMHPQIQLPKPGLCPICNMDLIPLETGAAAGGPREVSVGEHAAKLMELETALVERRFAAAEIRMIGMVGYDETKVSTLSAWVPGRIDRLFVDYTGMSVEKGDHLAEFYSPQLVNAQNELLHAIHKNPDMLDSVREKFRIWGFDAEQIKQIEERGKADDHMTINAPVGGIVIHKNAMEGMYVETGTMLFTIADLSRVWIQLDAYESDLNWLRYGGKVEFSTETYPGETFEGTISFIDPIINSATRTAKTRVIVENPDGRLKPGMFVRAVARPKVADGGRVMNPDLAGKWVSPMHPEIVKDKPGPCDVCGMPLVTAESLGYVATEANAPLLVPATATLRTGKRAVVYVEIPDRDTPTYEGREITLGPRLGDYYVVANGLDEGERVVTRGAFKLDSELQIQAKPSMMSMPSEPLPGESIDEMKPQTHCPIMGGEINRAIFADHNGLRVYFCCAGCDEEFKSAPDKYIAKMRAASVDPEKLAGPQTLCPIMGNPINKEFFVDHNGHRVYFCCPGCDATFKENPATYLAEMKAAGVVPEKVERIHAH